MRKLSPKEVEDFNKHEYQSFFKSEFSKDNYALFKLDVQSEDGELPSEIVAVNPLPLSFFNMLKLVEPATRSEIGFLIELPNLPYTVGRNYITVKRRNTPLEGNISVTLNVNKFTLLEIPDSAVTLLLDNTGNFQT